MKCKGNCGENIEYNKAFEGLPCNEYCCVCCPEGKLVFCSNARRFGFAWAGLLEDDGNTITRITIDRKGNRIRHESLPKEEFFKTIDLLGKNND